MCRWPSVMAAAVRKGRRQRMLPPSRSVHSRRTDETLAGGTRAAGNCEMAPASALHSSARLLLRSPPARPLSVGETAVTGKGPSWAECPSNGDSLAHQPSSGAGSTHFDRSARRPQERNQRKKCKTPVTRNFPRRGTSGRDPGKQQDTPGKRVLRVHRGGVPHSGGWALTGK